MNVVFYVLGGVLLLAVLESRHQTISATISAGGTGSIPQIVPPNEPPMQAMVGATAVDYAGEGVGIASSVLSGLKAIPVAGQIVAATVGAVLGPLLAAHKQRMADATKENQAVAAATPSFYQTMAAIVNAYNAGRATKQQAIAALLQLDQDTYTKLRSFVGSPGTAWGASGPGICDKTCTVGCCIYNTWFHVNIVGGPGGKVRGVAQVLNAGPGSAIWNGGRVTVAGIPVNKYGFPGYPAFAIQLRAS